MLQNGSRLAERGIKVHPAAAMFPLLADTAPDELRELADDIKKNGIQQPLALWTPSPIGRAVKEKSLLDGRNRLDALELAFGHDPGLFAEKLEDALYIDPNNGARLIYGDEDPWDFVVSANLHRRHLRLDKKKEIAAALLKARPERSDRAIGRQVGLHHSTVGTAVRAELERRGEISHVSTRVDSIGRQQPAARPSPPLSKAGQSYHASQREREAEQPAQAAPADDREPRDVVEGHKLLGLLQYVVTNSANIELKRARRGLDPAGLDSAWSALARCENWLREKVEAALRGDE
jgi:ParB-like chromosome segregation protein Spo0J